MTLVDWIQYFLFTCAAWILRRAVSSLYFAVKSRVDRALPDNLAVGAGPWLRSVIQARNLDIKVYVDVSKEQDIDAFFPSARVVRLSQEAYFKRDPSYWAVAAHELGHAMVWGRSQWIGVPLSTARFWGQMFVTIGSMLILANVLYAIPDVSTFAFRIFVAGVVLYVFTLGDEAAASILGMRVLEGDGSIDSRGLWGARIRLGAAYLTYLAAFAGQLVFVLQEKWITTMIATHRHFTPALRLNHGILAATLSIVLAVLATSQIVRAIRRPKLDAIATIKKRKTREFLWSIGCDVCAIVVLWFVWDQPFGIAFEIACIAALFGSRTGIALLLVPFILVPLGVLYVVVLVVMLATARLWAKNDEKRDEHGSPTDAELRETAQAYEQMYIDGYNHPEWHGIAVKIANAACQLCLVVLLWIALMRS